MTDFATRVRIAQSGTMLTELYPSGLRPHPGAAAVRSLTDQSEAAAAQPEVAAGTRTPELSPDERVQLVEAFVPVFEGLYAHLPLKRAMYAADPVQRLRLLAQRAASTDEQAFHYELARIVTGLRDAHTRYAGPSSLANRVAMLPFLVESYGAPPEARYIVSKVATEKQLIPDEHFAKGVELLWWNGVPIDRAVDLYAEFETGGRPDSRRARALESLTLRSLQYEPPPDERWVVVGYRDLHANEREVRIPWRVVDGGSAPTSGLVRPGHAHGIDPAREAGRRAKKLLFAPERWYAEKFGAAAAAGSRRRGRTARSGTWLETDFPDTLAAGIVETGSGRFGCLRLWSFDVADDKPFVQEVARLLSLIEAQGEQGLIIDLRGNPGGLILAAERMLQLLGPQQIVPVRFSFLATALTAAMAKAGQNAQELEPWLASLEDAVATGEPYSQTFPITSPDACNDIGQVHGGPVVAVVDPNTYSAGDIFAAGFFDNGLGTLVTVGLATGAGGANVWWSQQVRDALLGTPFAQAALPEGLDYSLAVRRATRAVGAASGSAIEDVGVRGRPYVMTRRDLTDSNHDLLEFCGAILEEQPLTRLQVAPPGPGAVSLQVATQGIERLDLYVDGRPEGWKEVSDGTVPVALPKGWSSVEVCGFAEGVLRQRRRLST